MGIAIAKWFLFRVRKELRVKKPNGAHKALIILALPRPCLFFSCPQAGDFHVRVCHFAIIHSLTDSYTIVLSTLNAST